MNDNSLINSLIACSFCGLSCREVAYLIRGKGNAAICDKCVAEALEAISEKRAEKQKEVCK